MARTPAASSGGGTGADFYLLALEDVPRSTWTVHSKVRDWIACCTTTAGPGGFPPNSLGRLKPCPTWVQAERCLFYPLYFLCTSLLPFGIPALPLLRLVSSVPTLKQLVGLMLLQVLLMRLQFWHWGRALRHLAGSGGATVAAEVSSQDGPLLGSKNSMRFTMEELFDLERQNHRYFSTRWVLPRSIVEVEEGSIPPALVCVTPHGVLPMGVSSAIHRVLGGRVTRFAAAPVLFKVWGIQKFLRRLGVYPAGKGGILECLAGGDHAGLVLDGIPGMFHGARPNGDEELWLLQRKAACAIALQAGCPIIPAYCFGTSELWHVVDPLGGLLRWLSMRLDVSLTPFFGRWWLPFGPPARRPLLLCFGDPIECKRPPQEEGRDRLAMQGAVDEKHRELLEAYRHIFDLHKAAYGRPTARLSFV